MIRLVPSQHCGHETSTWGTTNLIGQWAARDQIHPMRSLEVLSAFIMRWSDVHPFPFWQIFGGIPHEYFFLANKRACYIERRTSEDSISIINNHEIDNGRYKTPWPLGVIFAVVSFKNASRFCACVHRDAKWQCFINFQASFLYFLRLWRRTQA